MFTHSCQDPVCRMNVIRYDKIFIYSSTGVRHFICRQFGQIFTHDDKVCVPFKHGDQPEIRANWSSTVSHGQANELLVCEGEICGFEFSQIQSTSPLGSLLLATIYTVAFVYQTRKNWTEAPKNRPVDETSHKALTCLLLLTHQILSKI